jgi:hypothetical protein
LNDETQVGSAGTSDAERHSGGGEGESTPLQSRAKFLKNWSWLSVTQINSGLCERGGAQRGINSETHEAVAEEWEAYRTTELTLLETLQFLKSCHRRAPFLFFNGNTFAEIGRALATAIFSNLSLHRRKETASAAAHFITGVLEEEFMRAAIKALSFSTTLKIGDPVKTLKGSLRGRIVRIREDGRVAWKPEGASRELIALPESLLIDN